MIVAVHRMYVLWLNSVYQRVEDHRAVAVADTPEQLKEWEEGQRAAEPYQQDGKHLVYRPGSPIQWFNPPRWDDNPWLQVVTEAIVDDLSWIPNDLVNLGVT